MQGDICKNQDPEQHANANNDANPDLKRLVLQG